MKIKNILNALLLLPALAVTAVPAAAQTDYINEFYSEGFPHYNVLTGWSHDFDNGVHSLSIGGGTNNRFGTAPLPEWVGQDFVASTWFSVSRAQGGGTSPASVALVALGNNPTPGNYYLAYWGVAGGGAGTTGQLVILRTGGGNFTVTGDAVGHPEIGKIYELRLTGVYGEGTLTLTLALFDEEGQQIGPATTAIEPGTPLTGQHFGIRNRTAHTSHFLDVDHYRYSLSQEVLPPLPPVLIEFANLFPAPDTVFHAATGGLSFSVSTGPGNTMDPSDIDLFLNGEAVPQEELIVTGASPSFDVSFDDLESNAFYTAKVVARDNETQRAVSWSFNTLTVTGAQVVEDIALGMSTDDAIQGILGVSTAPPPLGSLVSLTDATSPFGPTSNVILGADNSTVAVTWDLGSPDSASNRTLTRVDVWVTGSDPWRTGFDGELAVSNDGVNFAVVPGSRFATALTYTGTSMEIGGTLVEGTGTNNFNLVRYYIPSDLFEEGFRYLQFISYGYNNLGGIDANIVRQPRIVEIDAFVTTAAPHLTGIVPLDGATFHPAGDGIQFTASTGGGNSIAPQDIQLFLNGEEIPSGELDITGSPSSREVAFTGLEVNRFYAARAVVRDDDRQTTHVWAFDTFSESAAVVIEATDYNFGGISDGVCPGTPVTGGDYFNNPIPSTYQDGQGYYPSDRANSYVDRIGVPGIDFHSNATVVGQAGITEYRWCDVVGTDFSNDFLRPKFEQAKLDALFDVPDYHLHRVQTGEWFNYTRDFPEDVYKVYLRASANGSPAMGLERVTSDPSVGGQTTVALGEFIPDATGKFGYTQLTDTLGQPLFLSLSGQETLRLTALSANNNIDVNFMAFVPATDIPPAVVATSPAHQAADALSGATIEVELADGVSPLDLSSIRLFLNGTEVAADIVQTAGGATASYTPGNMSPLEHYRATARVEFDDLAGSGPYSVEWIFTVKATFPFYNDFTVTDAFPVRITASGANADYTLDTANGAFNYTRNAGGSAGTKNLTVGLPIGGVDGQDFVMFSRSTMHGIDAAGQGGASSNGIRIGFGALSESDQFAGGAGSYYFVFWHAGGGPNEGDLRIQALGNSDGFTEGPGANIGSGVSGNAYDFVLEGVYTGGVLELTFSVFDLTAGGALLGSVTATDTQPLTGEYFGIRHSTSHVNHAMNLDHHDFGLLRPPADVPALGIARDGGQIVLTWDDPGAVLETALEVAGPWTEVEGATSPHIVDTTVPRRFFRLRVDE